jgi:hypothetical protein
LAFRLIVVSTNVAQSPEFGTHCTRHSVFRGRVYPFCRLRLENALAVHFRTIAGYFNSAVGVVMMFVPSAKFTQIKVFTPAAWAKAKATGKVAA